MSNNLKIIKSFKTKINLNIFSFILVIFVYIINIGHLNSAPTSSFGKSANFDFRNNFNQINDRYHRTAIPSPWPTFDEKSNKYHKYNESITTNHADNLIAELLPQKYNKNLRPNFGGSPIVVRISLRIYDIIEITETNMECKVDFVVRHYWKDPALTFSNRYNITELQLSEEFAKKIWLPDTFISNGRKTVTQKTLSAAESTLLRIAHDGEILYTTRLVVTANCPMDLTYFPLDQQKCSIMFTSYGLSDQDITLDWVNHIVPIEISSGINLPTFKWCGYSRDKFVATMATGNYTRLIFNMFLNRSIGFYVLQVYIPAFLIVVISWIPFWLDRNDNYARVTLGVTTVLTMATLFTNTNSDVPKISHLKAIDVYLFTCYLMVFGSLFEYSMVGFFELKRTTSGDKNDPSKAYGRKNRDKPQMQMKPQRALESTNGNFDDAHGRERVKRTSFTMKRLISDTTTIDNWARWGFPTVFIVFNLSYAFGLMTLSRFNNYEQQYEVKLNY